MKVRNKKCMTEGVSSEFNLHAISEIVVCFPDDCSSEFISAYDVYLNSVGEWKDMDKAFQDRDIIPDNYNTRFREPANDQERQRGWW